MRCTSEQEEDGRFQFLDTDVYERPDRSLQETHLHRPISSFFISNHLLQHNRSVVRNLIHTSVSQEEDSEREVHHLRVGDCETCLTVRGTPNLTVTHMGAVEQTVNITLTSYHRIKFDVSKQLPLHILQTQRNISIQLCYWLANTCRSNIQSPLSSGLVFTNS